jgi:uncharacterized membrane protein YphA (DoxX/SURF4 family)
MPKWMVSVGRIFYAIGLIGIGVQHFIFANFIPVIVPGWPAWIPDRPFWVCAVGVALVAAGISILFNIKARTVAVITGAVFLLMVVIGHIPMQLAGSPRILGAWNNAFKALSFCGGAWVVGGSFRERTPQKTSFFDRAMPIGRFFLPVMLIVFGIEHFLYAPFVAMLIPAWIPGKVFWTYFAGVALIAGGAGMLFRTYPRLAALLSGIMMFLWVFLLHIPRAIADPHSGFGNEWTSVFEALAYSGVALILAALPVSNAFSISASK